MATAPGIHPSVNITEFPVEERRIIYALSECFYVTNADDIKLGTATYRYVITRPADNVAHAIPNAREIIFLFSPYENFEARTLDAYFHVQSSFEDHRINGHFRLLCSLDPNIKLKMQKICIDEPDIPVTIPFTYDELDTKNIRQRVTSAARESYHFRDLFAQRSPLQNDTYFFGRSDILARLRDRISRSENSGVFGLRKSGKTSILLAAQRAAQADGHRFTLLDCQSPSVTSGAWHDVLRLISVNLRKLAGLSTTVQPVGDFSAATAAESFEKAVNDVYSRGKRLSIVAFDEIEHLSPNSGAGNWRNGENAKFLWQTIRSVQQRIPGRISFLIAGTNPQITESRQIAGADNPLLEYVHADYLGGLSDRELQSMCQSIGDLMGMDFEIDAIATLYKSLGGHPYLSRQVCSHIHQNLSIHNRPARVTNTDVSIALGSFDFAPLLDDVLSSLRERYPDEYTLLQWIALGDEEQVAYFIDQDPQFARHLEGYGIIDVIAGRVRPRLELALDYLRRRAKRSELIKGATDRWADISARRGAIEVELRAILRGRIIELFGKAGAADGLRAWLTRRRAEEIEHCSLEEIFSPEDCRLYWSDVMQAMRSDEKYWASRLDASADEIFPRLELINKHRNDAHAKEFKSVAYDQLSDALDWLREAV